MFAITCERRCRGSASAIRASRDGQVGAGQATGESGGGASYEEEERLVLYMTGNFETENWQNKSRTVNYYDLAQFVFIILQKCLRSEKGELQNYKQEKIDDPLFDYGMRIVNGTVEIGRLGKVKTALVKDFGIKQEIFYEYSGSSIAAAHSVENERQTTNCRVAGTGGIAHERINASGRIVGASGVIKERLKTSGRVVAAFGVV